MFFVGLFSNIIPLLVLCVVSLGFYVNGSDSAMVSLSSGTQHIFETYSLEIDNSSSIDYESADNPSVKDFKDKALLSKESNPHNYSPPLLNYTSIKIASDTSRGSPQI